MADGALWVATRAAALRIDPNTNQIERTLHPPAGEVTEVAWARVGGGTGSTQGLTEIDVYSVVAPPPMTCQALPHSSHHAQDPIHGTSTATLTIEATAYELAHGTCQTLRNAAGIVVQYTAYFGSTEEATDTSATLVIDDGYVGDGTYEGRLVINGPSRWYGPATVIVDRQGLHGMVTGAMATLQFDCAAGSDVALEPRVLSEPAPGHAWVETPEGIVLNFKNVGCSLDTFSDELHVLAPSAFPGAESPYYLELESIEAAVAGELDGTLSFTYYGRVFPFTDVQLVLACGQPVKGTFAGEGYKGAFSCPQ
jgi:hypothetical protein